MDADSTYPLTIGQLSVWRDVERMPPDRLWEANLVFLWDLPPGHTTEEVWAALGALAMHHETLRIVYDASDGTELRQRIGPATPQAVLATARRTEVDVADLEALRDIEYHRPMDFTAAPAWCAWVVTDAGAPVQVMAVVSHMAADAHTALMLEADLAAILDGRPLQPAGSLLEMAVRQYGAGAGRLRAAERYWTRTLDEAPRRSADQVRQHYIGAMLETGLPLPLVHEAATALGVSAATFVLAAFYRGLHRALGTTQALIYLMSANRFDADAQRVATSMVQWVPMVVELDGSAPLAEVATKLHWKSFNAFKFGICPPDFIDETRHRFEHGDPPGDHGFSYNAMIAPPGFPSDDTVVPWTLDWITPARQTGPETYMIVRGLSSLAIELRMGRPGTDRDTVETCLATIAEDMRAACGLPATPTPVSA